MPTGTGSTPPSAPQGRTNVYATHGYTDIFARWLTGQGLNARVVATEFTGETLEDGDAADTANP